jgi:very-short-patch-repair endonuclease
MTRFYNRSSEKPKRRDLRKKMSRAEVLLWSRLRDREINNLKFRRQYSVGPYILDFYCPEAKLAVEVDGDTHFGNGAEVRDAHRQRFVEWFGFRFVRCTNGEVLDRMEGVLEEIERVASECSAERDAFRERGKNPP